MEPLHKRVLQLYQQAKYAEAIPIAEEYIAVASAMFGEAHPLYADGLGGLGVLYQALDRLGEAEPLLKRALAIKEKALAPEHIEVADALHDLAELYRKQSRFSEAEPLYKRALSIIETAGGPTHPGVGIVVGNLAELYRAQGRHTEAEPLLRRALAINEKSLGPEHLSVANALNNLAGFLDEINRLTEVEPLYKRALEITEKTLPAGHPEIATSINKLAEFYRIHGHYAEAEPLHLRALAIRESALGPDHPAVAVSLNNLAVLYKDLGRYDEAEPLHKRSLAINERTLGPNHPSVGNSLNNLASLYQAQGRYPEAEPLFRRSLAICETAFGADHPDVALALNNLALLYQIQGRYTEAEPLHKRSLAIREKVLGPNHSDVAGSLNNLAILYEAQGRLASSEPLKKRALAIRENALGPDHPEVAKALNNLAYLYHVQGRYSEAEPLLKRALTIAENNLGPNHPFVATPLNNLAELYQHQGQYQRAELLYKRSLTIREKTLGTDHEELGISLNNLGNLYQREHRWSEAEPLLGRAISVFEKALGHQHPTVHVAVSNLALVYQAQGHYSDAERLLERSLSIHEKALGPDHPTVGLLANNLGAVYLAQNRFAEARPHLERSLAIREKALGNEHPDIGESLSNLGLLFLRQAQYADADRLLKRALAVSETLGPDHPQLAVALSNLAGLHYAQKDWATALKYMQRSAEIIVRRSMRGGEVLGRQQVGVAMSETARSNFDFLVLIKAAHRAGGVEQGESTASGLFQYAQWAQSSEAAASIAQMSARLTTEDKIIAQLVRERQDGVAEWQARDKLLIAARSQSPDKRNRAAEDELSTRLSAIDGRIAEIDTTLKDKLPHYATLVRPEPLTVAEVQAVLGSHEALVLFLDTPEVMATAEETFVWVVTKTDLRRVRSDLGTKGLTERVASLRCGLDRTSWDFEGRSRCANLLAIDVETAPKENEPLPFDLSGAHALYRALFGQVADLIKDKHLLIVPSGPLAQLPFHVLLTEKLDPGGKAGTEVLRRAAWLAKSNAITVLPSVSSLKALREHAKGSKAKKALIGFGNPLLEGRDANNDSLRVEQARARQNCAKVPSLRITRSTGGGTTLPQQRGGFVDVRTIRAQVPLPETADELCAVARSLGVPESDIWLGARANEHEIKRLSDSGELATYRTVHFATHGALAGELRSGTEPGLILTPPPEGSTEDDGYLSVSEIASLKLDADLVILSACNTAAGGAPGTEALSGMARAFFYAGARSLLVSHWAVNSDSTVKLITKALSIMSSDQSVGRAEALRRSMLAMIESGDPKEVHPEYWAPFVVVGEGSSAASPIATSTIAPVPGAAVIPAPVGGSRKPGKISRPKANEPWTARIWKGQ
ncbi:MAG TPA: CHAT domain-containing tetratricopeptide repeat protein [Hyphomicrobiaceae bacterium]